MISLIKTCNREDELNGHSRHPSQRKRDARAPICRAEPTHRRPLCFTLYIVAHLRDG